MKTLFGTRLWILIIALMLVSGGTVYGLFSAWQRVHQLQSKFTGPQMKSFQMASEIRRDLLTLNNSMLKYVLIRDSADWTEFDKDSRYLDRWIDDHDPSMNPRSVLTTEKERQVFKTLNDAYDDFLAAARAVHTNGMPALVGSAQLVQLDSFNAQADRMRDLIRELSDAHRTAETTFLASATASLASLQHILITSIVLLLALVTALVWVIYRDTIAPLRTQLAQSQSLLERQEKLATLGTLAAGIAHEIRNPLTSLKARLYTLEKHLRVVPAARKDTDIINSEINRLEHIVQDVLSFARPAEPKLETLATVPMLREVQGLMAPNLESLNVKLVVEAGPDLAIRADSGHLKQVLVNLARNGAEAIDGQGTVTMRARATRAQLGGREINVVILEVSDTGKGIPAEIEKRMFDPFFSTKETGTGLGLALSARLIDQQGGRLQYQTQPGRGTTFSVVLPREMNDIRNYATLEANRPASDGDPKL